MSGSESEMLDRTLAGDEGAFTALYRLRQGAIFRFVLHMTGSVEIAEDVTQETFLVLLTHGRRFDPSRGNLGSFLYGIARNQLLRRLESRPLNPPDGDPVSSEDLFDDLTRRQTIDQVRRAVLTLPTPYREAVVLCDLEETTYEEAAGILEIPIGTVRSRLNRGRALLAHKLKVAKGVCNV